MTAPSSQNSFSIEFASKQTEARLALIETVAQFPKLGISKIQRGGIEIALAEAVNNVVEHACAGLPNASGRITCQINEDSLIIEISDSGRPMPDFRPPTGAKANLSVPIAELPEGGFGWFLIREMAANVSYERANGQNRLTLEFHTQKSN